MGFKNFPLKNGKLLFYAMHCVSFLLEPAWSSPKVSTTVGCLAR
jgi:hypothetical protein